jgi:hypothetical protein
MQSTINFNPRHQAKNRTCDHHRKRLCRWTDMIKDIKLNKTKGRRKRRRRN